MAVCLALPGKIIGFVDPLESSDPIAASALATVLFGSVTRIINMECVPQAQVGDFVIAHAGVALQLVDQTEAQKVIAEIEALTQLGEAWT